jgi:hypothetical protein
MYIHIHLNKYVKYLHIYIYIHICIYKYILGIVDGRPPPTLASILEKTQPDIRVYALNPSSIKILKVYICIHVYMFTHLKICACIYTYAYV